MYKRFNTMDTKVQNIFSNLILLIIGILFVAIDGAKIVNIVFIILGVLIIIFNIQNFITCCKNLKYKTPAAIGQFTFSLLTIALGVILIILQGKVSIIIGILLLVYAIYKIIMNRNFIKEEVYFQLPLILVAIVLMFLGNISNILLTVIGVIFIIAALFNIILAIFYKRK